MSILNINSNLFKRQSFWHQQGMLMLELLIALFLVSLFTLIIVYYQTLIVRWQHYTIHYMKIVNSMHNCAHMMRNNSQLVYQQAFGDDNIQVQWKLHDVPVPQGMPYGTRHVTRMKIVEIKGWHDNDRRAYAFATGVVI